MTTTLNEADEFEDPEPARRKIEHDGWGRYKLPHPETGKERSWTRVTTIAGTLEDRYHLEEWGKRKVLEGVVLERGIVSLAAAVFGEHGFDPQTQDAKKALNRLTKQAVDTAGVSKGADTGTALHAVTEDYNQGRESSAKARALELGLEGNLLAYHRTLRREGITVLPEFMERVVCIPDLNAVGRLDNLVREAGTDLLRVFDLKSQKTLDFGALKIAIQLAMYVNAEAMFDEDTWTWVDMPPVDREVGTVCWLPVLEDENDKVCQLYDVDLTWGWRWAKASFQTRKARNSKPLTLRKPRTVVAPAAEVPRMEGTQPMGVLSTGAVPPMAGTLAEIGQAMAQVQADSAAERDRSPLDPPQGVDWEARFRETQSMEELLRVGRECKESGSMTEALQALGKKIRAELAA